MPNKVNPYSAFSMQVQQEVLESLEKKNQTTNDLVKSIKRPYHTIRQAVLELENNGSIIQYSRAYRNTKYKVADETVVTDRIIPTIQLNHQKYKISVILGTAFNETMAQKAAANLPKHVARILKVAERLNLNDRKAAASLELIRHEMETDRDAVVNLLSVYDQVLKNGKIWSQEHLANFPNDSEWPQDTLDAAYEVYFPR